MEKALVTEVDVTKYRLLFEEFLVTENAARLFARTLKHPELGHLTSWAPTDWLLKYANPLPLTETNTAGADGLEDRLVGLEALFQSIVEHGMRDPMVIGIGLNGCVRLESGNQRIRCFAECGIAFVPVVGYVNDTAITHNSNGLHEGIELSIDASQLQAMRYMHVCLNAVIDNMPFFRMPSKHDSFGFRL